MVKRLDIFFYDDENAFSKWYGTNYQGPCIKIALQSKLLS